VRDSGADSTGKIGGDSNVINRRDGRKIDQARAACSIPFGSPVRKCVTAAQEANLHPLDVLDLLEIASASRRTGTPASPCSR